MHTLITQVVAQQEALDIAAGIGILLTCLGVIIWTCAVVMRAGGGHHE